MKDKNDIPLEKGDFLKIDGEVYQVKGDYRNVCTELDYDIENINNPRDNLMVSEQEAKDQLGHKWQIIELPTW